MRVLLTGASGFVGSHILDTLRARGIPTAVLLRPTSDRQFIAPHLPSVEVHPGSINDLDSLNAAMGTGITHVIHCAGCIRARNESGFFEVNQIGTRNVVSAVNSRAGAIQRLLHISSLAVTGPATAAKPAREDDPLQPISTYGRSKLAAELEVRDQCRVPYTILRPPAVYGPRDGGFLPMFKAVANHVLPRPSATQALSMVYGPDLAQATVVCLEHPAAAGRTYFVANPQIISARILADEIAAQLPRWTLPCPLPPLLLWPLCLGQEIVARLTGKPMLLNLQKFAELRAPGWVCDPSRLKAEIGCECSTDLKVGVASTLKWYVENEWVR